jgi:hypothetical protein
VVGWWGAKDVTVRADHVTVSFFDVCFQEGCDVREIVLSRLRESMARVRLRALALMVLAVLLAACTSSGAPSTTTKPVPAVDLSATPTGWVPVADGDVQISVPATWSVLYNSCPTGSPPGEVLVNPANTYCPAFGQGGPKNVVWLVSRSYAGFRPSVARQHDGTTSPPAAWDRVRVSFSVGLVMMPG